MDQEVRGEVRVPHLPEMADEPHLLTDAEPGRQLLVGRELRIADDDQPECLGPLAELRRFAHPGDAVEQRLEPFEPIVHRREESDRVARGESPRVAHLLPSLQPIVLRKPGRIDRAADHVQILGRHRVVMLEVIADHEAVDDDQRLLRSEILATLKQRVRPVSRIEQLDDAGDCRGPPPTRTCGCCDPPTPDAGPLADRERRAPTSCRNRR